MKCQACHSGTQSDLDERKNGDCISCHMPRVQLHPALKFTDHDIRVVKMANVTAYSERWQLLTADLRVDLCREREFALGFAIVSLLLQRHG